LVQMIGHAGGRKVLDVRYRTGAPGLAMHRASLFGVLWDQVQTSGVQIVTGAAVTGHDDGWLRRDKADALGPFDLIVDASGAGSVLSPLKARKLNFGAVWATVSWPQTALPANQLTQRYLRASRMAGVMPIGCLPGDPTPKAALFWSQSEAEAAAWPTTDFAAWQAATTVFWPDFAAFTAPLTHADLTQARYSHGSLALPYADGIAFIGDAAHRASPQLGQGANMALLDAMALTRALNGGLHDALPRYAAMRRWHRRFYQGFSAVMTPMYQSDSRLLPMLRDWGLAPTARMPVIRGILTALVCGDVLPPLSGEVWP